MVLQLSQVPFRTGPVWLNPLRHAIHMSCGSRIRPALFQQTPAPSATLPRLEGLGGASVRDLAGAWPLVNIKPCVCVGSFAFLGWGLGC